jgi:hypothetical protein
MGDFSPSCEDIQARLRIGKINPPWVQCLGASDCKTELSRRNILADSGSDQMVQRTVVVE